MRRWRWRDRRSPDGAGRITAQSGKAGVCRSRSPLSRGRRPSATDYAPPCGASSGPLPSVLVIGLLAIEDALERLEVPQRRRLAAVAVLVAEFRDRGVDRLRRHALERTSGPHRIELHLRRALEVIEL